MCQSLKNISHAQNSLTEQVPRFSISTESIDAERLNAFSNITVLRFGAIFNQILPAILQSLKTLLICLLEPLVTTVGMTAVVADFDGQLDVAVEREAQLKNWPVSMFMGAFS